MASTWPRDTVVVLIVIWATRAFYLLSAFAILTVRLLPALGDRFLAYGARTRPRRDGNRRNNQTVGIDFLDYLTTFNVPHSWFIHFYVLSLACSLASLCAHYYSYYDQRGIPAQYWAVAALSAHLMFLQSLRRFLECIFVTQAGSARMWVGHYAIGIAFYAFTNVAIWVEYVRQPLPSTLWTWRNLVCILVFLAASWEQNRCHLYLSSLRKYTLPTKSIFQYIVAPHYTMECVIYLTLAILNAPVDGHSGHPTAINWTLFCALVFVVVNLGVTAGGTKHWQLDKFPDQKCAILKKWKMIPMMY